MKLYEFNPFPNPRRVRMFLAEKGIKDVEMIQIDVPAGEHRSEEFIKKNPSAVVPVLELDDGTCISESSAISRFFEDTYPEPKLMGATPKESSVIDMWQKRVEQSLMGCTSTYFHHATEGLGALELYQNKEWGEKNREMVRAGFKQLNQQLATNKYVAGDEFSIADITALCSIDFALHIKIENLEDYPNIKHWYQEVSSRPSAGA